MILKEPGTMPVMDVVVVSGTVGRGKTTIALALGQLLWRRGHRAAVLDVDCLTELVPAPVTDPFNERIALAHLRSMVGNWRAAKVDVLVLARVLETAEDRGRYAAAVGDAAMRVVRVDASLPTRRRRLVSREPAGDSREWHLARTEELAAILGDCGVEDLVVLNEGREPTDVAAEIADWLRFP